MTPISWHVAPYHIKDGGAFVKVGSGQHGPWKLQCMPYKYVFENFVVWRCETCRKLIDSDVPNEYSYRGLFTVDRDDWETPDGLFAQLHSEFHFTLDVCASANSTKCARYFDIEQNGLKQSWSNDICWMNPPYGRQIKKWIRKAYAESFRGATVVCLVAARTDTVWWNSYAVKGEIRFIRGRIRFKGAKWNSPFPSAIIIFRPQ